jgi:hypothetical protein
MINDSNLVYFINYFPRSIHLRFVILISHISFNVRPLPLSIDRFLMKANLKKIHRFDCQLSKEIY